MKTAAKATAWLMASLLLVVALVALRYYGLLPRRRPAAQLTAPRTLEAVERGRYLASSVAACMTCHSEIDEAKPGDAIVPGRLGSGRDFGNLEGLPGRMRAPNLTSSADGLGHWSDGEIVRAIREGISRDGRPLFPFMPYPVYARQLSDDDALALVAYLRTLPPISGKPAPTEVAFPVSMFARAAPAPVLKDPGPLPAEPLARGQRLLELASCGECHDSFDSRHQPLPGMRLAGGFAFQVPGRGTVYASNLTPDPGTGNGHRSEETLLRALKAGVGHDGRILYVMPWTGYTGLTDQDARAMVAALRALPPVGNAVPGRRLREP